MMSRNNYGPRATDGIAHQLDSQIAQTFREFHIHSKDCRACRNPILAYQEGRDLCHDGRALSVNITKLLYKKAEHVPQGTFTVEYKSGWEAVDGLVRIICHYNQGYFTNQIVDVRRFPKVSQPPAIEPAPAPIHRGSQWEEDLARRQRAGNNRRANHAVHGDPRTSLLDASSGRTQADISPASSSRSVHFDSYIRVREFDA
ncbi:hypothetical protein BDD12DRAFT_228808 [Trichophaea hybrida]|nr:hypothetical protein BDD12DRAFT_228808 [Trichophaea hybrida]